MRLCHFLVMKVCCRLCLIPPGDVRCVRSDTNSTWKLLEQAWFGHTFRLKVQFGIQFRGHPGCKPKPKSGFPSLCVTLDKTLKIIPIVEDSPFLGELQKQWVRNAEIPWINTNFGMTSYILPNFPLSFYIIYSISASQRGVARNITEQWNPTMTDIKSLGTLPITIRAAIYLYSMYLASYAWRNTGKSSQHRKLCYDNIWKYIMSGQHWGLVECWLPEQFYFQYLLHTLEWDPRSQGKVAKSIDLCNYITFWANIWRTFTLI